MSYRPASWGSPSANRTPNSRRRLSGAPTTFPRPQLRYARSPLVGGALFSLAYPEHFKAAGPIAEIPAFQPLLYSVDLVLPIVDLGQHDAWLAEGPAQLGVFLTLAGWVLATAAVAALTGLLKKD